MKRILLILVAFALSACQSTSKKADVGIDSLIRQRENEKALKLDHAKFLAGKITEYVTKKEEGIISEKELKDAADPLQIQLNEAIKGLDSAQVKELNAYRVGLLN